MATSEELENRIEKAVDVIVGYGVYDGSHHKQWVLNRVLEILCDADEYEEILKNYPDWDVGLAP